MTQRYSTFLFFQLSLFPERGWWRGGDADRADPGDGEAVGDRGPRGEAAGGHTYPQTGAGLQSARAGITPQHYSTVLNIAYHYSTLLSITQHFSTILTITQHYST